MLRPFTEWFREHARGTVEDEMTAAIAEAVNASFDMQKKSVVMLKITIEPQGMGRRTVSTECVVESKLPKPGAEQSIFYPDEDGGLHKEDPYQSRLDISGARTVDPETGQIKELTTDE